MSIALYLIVLIFLLVIRVRNFKEVRRILLFEFVCLLLDYFTNAKKASPYIEVLEDF